MPSRRDLLTALAAAGLAGCTGSPGTGETPSRTPERTPDGTPPTATRTDTPTGSTAGGPTETPAEPAGLAVRWVRELGGSVRHRPTVHEGTLYVAGGTNGNTPPREYLRPESAENVYAFDRSGEERWRHEARAGVGGPPRVVAGGVHAVVGWSAGTHGADQRLVRIVEGERRWTTEPVDEFLSILGSHEGGTFVGTGDDALGLSGETIRAVDRDGTDRWRVESGDAYEGTVHDGTLYVPYGHRRTTALDVETGSERWGTLMGPAGDDPRVFGDTLHLSAEEQNDDGDYPLVAVDAATGEERWRYAAAGGNEGPFVPTGAVEDDETGLVFGTEHGGLLFALDAATGEERWRYTVDADTREPPAFVDGTVYLPALDGRVHAVAPDGERRWIRSVGEHVVGVRANEAGVVAVSRGPEGTPHGLVALAHDGSERWSFSHPCDLTRASVVGSNAYVGTEGGFVVALGP